MTDTRFPGTPAVLGAAQAVLRELGWFYADPHEFRYGDARLRFDKLSGPSIMAPMVSGPRAALMEAPVDRVNVSLRSFGPRE